MHLRTRVCPRFKSENTCFQIRNSGSGESSKEVSILGNYATPAARSRPGFSLLFVVYIAVGAAVAATHHYWSNLHNLKQIISALLATILWPLILLGVNLHIH